jgi:hypothetical protein
MYLNLMRVKVAISIILMSVISSIQKNIGSIDTHVEDYKRMIENLQVCLGNK